MSTDQTLAAHSANQISNNRDNQLRALKNYSNELQKQINKLNKLEKETNNILSFSNPNILFPSIVLISGLTAAASLAFGNTSLLLGCTAIGMSSGILHLYSLVKNLNDSLADNGLQAPFLPGNSPLPPDHTTDSVTLDSLQQTKAIKNSSQQSHGRTGSLFFRNTSKSADPNEEEQAVSYQLLNFSR